LSPDEDNRCGDWALAMVVVGGEGAKREHSEGIRIQKEKSQTQG